MKNFKHLAYVFRCSINYCKPFPVAICMVCTFLLVSFDGLTQETKPQPKLHLQSDRDFYVLGEIIRFAVFSLDPANLNEKIMVLDLVAPSGKIVETRLIRIADGCGAGDIILDKSLKPGVYRAFTYPERRAVSDKMAISQVKIPVYSLEEKKNYLSIDQSAENRANGDLFSSGNTGSAQVFDKGNGQLDISITLSKKTFSKREPVELKLLTTDQNGVPVPANLAVSVFNKAFKMPRNTRNDTFSGVNTIPAPKSPPISDIIAYIRNLKETSLKTLSRVSVFFIEDQVIEEFYIDELDELIYARNGLRADNHILIYGFNWKGDRLGQIIIENFEDDHPRMYPAVSEKLPYSKTVQEYIDFRKKKNIIDMVYEIPRPDHFAHHGFLKEWEEADYSVKLADFNRLPTMKEVIRGVVPKTHIKKENGKHRIFLSPKTSSFKYDNTPLILINNLPTFEDSLLLSMNVNDVEKIEVRNAIRTQGEFGTYGNKGILSVFLKEGVENPLAEKINRLPKIKAISAPLSFINGRQKETEDKIPDFRQLLYWEPLVQTDQQGKATIKFENADILTNYEVNIQGFSLGGEIGKAVIQYQVLPNGK